MEGEEKGPCGKGGMYFRVEVAQESSQGSYHPLLSLQDVLLCHSGGGWGCDRVVVELFQSRFCSSSSLCSCMKMGNSTSLSLPVREWLAPQVSINGGRASAEVAATLGR